MCMILPTGFFFTFFDDFKFKLSYGRLLTQNNGYLVTSMVMATVSMKETTRSQ